LIWEGKVSRADWLAIVGIIISIALGIPSVPALAQGNLALGLVTLLFALIILGLTIYMYWSSQLPPYTIFCSRNNLTIHDPEGKSATLRQTITIRANHHGLEHYVYRNMSFDGSMSDIKVGPNVTLSYQGGAAGDHNFEVRFPRQLRRFERVTIWYEVTFADSFPSKSEAFVLQIDNPTKEAIIEIFLPKETPPRDVIAIYVGSGRRVELGDRPIVDSDQISWQRAYKVRHLPYGDYEFRWNWR
jgi:hypothetical protein